MTISVCMSTFNGEKYIEEQLYSILHQTCKPDEVILCDDASSDKTVAIIRNFIRDNCLEGSWKLYENAENRGYPAGFYYAMSICGQELVFLSDQDDVWHEKKIERMCAEFARHPEAKAICCKFGLIDAEGGSIRTLMAPARTGGTGELRRVSIEDVFFKCEWPGMVVAYRNAWYQAGARQLTPGIMAGIPHDFLVCARAAEEGGFLQMDQELACHRRHEGNTGGEEHRMGKLLNKERKLREIQDYLSILDALTEGRVMRTEGGCAALRDKRRVMGERYEALCSGKIGRVLLSAWKNRKSVRLATAVCDVLIVRQ